ncbi:ADP-ribosylglycohydrolase family protein [Candidatus Bathyarchaeota archaeon]|nr:ADP-ribosylglycohydrolase family protein [Candidatus Bathyarchaeota archaeon]
MNSISKQDRIKGTLMGAIIGDALGLGPHWIYNPQELVEKFGAWIDDYMAVIPNPRFPAVWASRKDLKLGDVSQTGQVYLLLLESVAVNGKYIESDFTKRFDGLLETLDGTSAGGRYTDEAMIDVWNAKKEGVEWPYAGSYKDTAEAAMRAPIIAALHADDQDAALNTMIRNVALTHCDPVVVGQSTAFGMHIWMLINGIEMKEIAKYYHDHRSEFNIRFKAASNWTGTDAALSLRDHEVSFTDALDRPSVIYDSAHDPRIQIEPAHLVSRLYTPDCRITHLLPAAYYLASRYESDFEMAVLSAINGGGNNMARAALTGALSGAMNGLSGIPERFITGLEDNERILELVESLV